MFYFLEQKTFKGDQNFEGLRLNEISNWSINTRIEVLDLNFGFESRARAISCLKFRGWEAIIGRTQIHNMPSFGRESRNLSRAASNNRSSMNVT